MKIIKKPIVVPITCFMCGTTYIPDADELSIYSIVVPEKRGNIVEHHMRCNCPICRALNDAIFIKPSPPTENELRAAYGLRAKDDASEC